MIQLNNLRKELVEVTNDEIELVIGGEGSGPATPSMPVTIPITTSPGSNSASITTNTGTIAPPALGIGIQKGTSAFSLTGTGDITAATAIGKDTVASLTVNPIKSGFGGQIGIRF